MASTLFEAAFEQVQTLVSQFDAGKAHYLSAAYQEEEARRDFIDKFWTALGWDVNHERTRTRWRCVRCIFGVRH